MFRYTLETLPDGDVRITLDRGPADDALSVTRTYTVRHGQVHIRLPEGGTARVHVGLAGLGRYVDIAPGASLEQTLLGLL